MSKYLKTPMAVILIENINNLYVEEPTLLSKAKVMASVKNPRIEYSGTWSDETLSIHSTIHEAMEALEKYSEQLEKV
ncbi:hypothetical protein G7059_01730 [Erysipelothrix sp. HDW6A]|uniref:hypothetical protein n=1 Tax=Erysipelothrix sp. HDW6A TaxID=2714928 RepID=UPI00140D66A9|nr:hypothetical protein [Erysipelothrix sp. HDW6A]QIK56654.1 hypothetical protein G7059_01730 [Erysipelothrix sp. HDW6A]